MMQPIWDKLHSYSDTLRKLQELEANRCEDEDIVVIENNLPELDPKCSNLQELEELIQESNITRNIEYLVVHCTGTSLETTVTSIQNHWKNNLGWKNPGYHILIDAEGNFTYLHNFNQVSNGVAGFNHRSIHISYIGGVENKDSKQVTVDNMTDAQFTTMDFIIKEFIKKIPNLKVQGHRDFPKVAKACPCFDTKIKFNLK